METMTAVDAVTQLGGVARTRDAAAMSSKTRVRTAVRRGELVRVSRGRIAVPVTDRALVMARKIKGHVSHLSAALHHGWAVKYPPELPQVTVRPGGVIPDGSEEFLAEVHQRRLPPSDTHAWATTPLRTVLDCARDLPFDVALCVADSALREGALTQDDLLAAARNKRERRIAAHADGRAANPFESVLRAICIMIGLEVIPQYATTCDGVTFHPDLANPLLGLAIEADSYTFHGREPRDHDRDCSRYNAMTLAQWAVLRFTWSQVMQNPGSVARTLRLWLATTAEELNRPRHAA